MEEALHFFQLSETTHPATQVILQNVRILRNFCENLKISQVLMFLNFIYLKYLVVRFNISKLKKKNVQFESEIFVGNGNNYPTRWNNIQFI